MKKGLVITGMMIFCINFAVAQQKIEIGSPKLLSTEVHLYDAENNFLLTLPLTFQLTDKNILIMMAGNDIRLANRQSVLMFSDEVSLTELLKSNRNVNAVKSFKIQNTEFDKVLLPNRKISIMRKFDDGYEIIKKNSKPVFFDINDSSPNQIITFHLQFYIAKSDNKFPYILTAKCNPIEVELLIK